MKKGVTLISIIIYLVLFTTFTAFAVSLTSNMNRSVLTDKGNSIVETDYSKIYSNLFSSAKESDYYFVDGEKINFSNGDNYFFDIENKKIYKNGGVISNNLDKFSIKELAAISNTTLNSNVLSRGNSLYIEVGLSKYDSNLIRDIIVSVGDDLK